MTRIADFARLIHPEDAWGFNALLCGLKWIKSHGKLVARGGEGVALRFAGTNADNSNFSDRMKNGFIAIVSHELRTPPTAISPVL